MNELLVILEGKPDTTVDGTPHDLSEGEAIALGPSGSQELSSQDSKPALVPIAG